MNKKIEINTGDIIVILDTGTGRSKPYHLFIEEDFIKGENELMTKLPDKIRGVAMFDFEPKNIEITISRKVV